MAASAVSIQGTPADQAYSNARRAGRTNPDKVEIIAGAVHRGGGLMPTLSGRPLPETLAEYRPIPSVLDENIVCAGPASDGGVYLAVGDGPGTVLNAHTARQLALDMLATVAAQPAPAQHTTYRPARTATAVGTLGAAVLCIVIIFPFLYLAYAAMSTVAA